MPYRLGSDSTDSFGGSLAVTADTLVVGARSTTLEGNPGQGIVYVYTRSGQQWVMSAKITAPDGRARDNFGVSIAIVGDRLFIGSQGAVSDTGGQGAVYLFYRKGGQWQFAQKLVASNPQGVALFGAMVRADGDKLLVGAYGEDNYRGAAYVFARSTHGYAHSTRLTASDRAPGDVFGYYGDVADNVAAVGAYTKAVDGKAQQGAAYFFKPPAPTSRSG